MVRSCGIGRRGAARKCPTPPASGRGGGRSGRRVAGSGIPPGSLRFARFPFPPPRPGLSAFARLPLDRVKTGVLPASLYEVREGGARLLLAAGETVGPKTLARLRRRGVRDLVVERAFLKHVRTPGADADDREPPREPVPLGEARRVPEDALIRALTKPAGVAGPARAAAAAARRDAIAARVNRLFASASLAEAGAGGPVVDGAGLRELSVQSVADLAEDLDLFARIGLDRPTADRKPWEPAGDARDRLREHSVRTAHLALAVGAVMGLRRDELENLAMGCLIHDAGMTRIDVALWDSPRRLSAVEFLEITKHPLRTFDLLADVPEVPVAARMVAYQLHERWDGGGYPRRRSGRQIHRLARIAAVADAYCGLTADRPHRPALAPHAAARKLAAAAVRGSFDPDAVRGFLETVSVFPLGSGVRLSDGRSGRVIEARRHRPAEPLIELWDPLAGRFTGETVDLAAGPTDPGATADRPRIVSAGDLDHALARAA